MAEAVNGGDWSADYTEAQQRGWILKVRWALERYCCVQIDDADAPSTSKSYTQTFKAGETYRTKVLAAITVAELERAERERNQDD